MLSMVAMLKEQAQTIMQLKKQKGAALEGVVDKRALLSNGHFSRRAQIVELERHLWLVHRTYNKRCYHSFDNEANKANKALHE